MSDKSFEESGPVKQPGRPHYEGHRARLWQRFSKSAGSAVEDYELLELVLYNTIRRADTKPIAKALMKKFGSLSAVLGASIARLQDVDGIGARGAEQIKLFHVIAERCIRSKINQRHVLSSWEEVLSYCRLAMGHSEIEEFRILFLDKKNGLIAEEVQQRGTVDHTPVYPRELLKRALELSASSLILLHNHPSGDIMPSRVDIQMTRKIDELSRAFNITVYDHIIIGRSGHASMRALKLI